MAEEKKKKVVTTTSKGLIALAVIEAVIIIILILSGFKSINPYLLFFAFLASGVFIYFWLKKPKQMDLPEQIEFIADRWMEKVHVPLNTNNANGIPITPDISLIYFPNEAATFQIEGKRITGLEDRHLLNVLKSREKSGLLKDTIKYLGTEAKVKQAAEAANVDVESLGL